MSKDDELKKQVKRLHSLGMVYVGSLAEVATGKEVSFIPSSAPGVHNMRDLISLVLLTRAEINGVSKMLLEAKLITPERFNEIMTAEYKWFADVKSESLGVEATDVGLVVRPRKGDVN